MIIIPRKWLLNSDGKLGPGGQFFIFAVGFVVVFTLFNLIAGAIAIALYGINTITDIANGNLTSPHIANALWILQVIGTTIPIFVAPVLFAVFFVKDPADYLKPTLRFPMVLMILVFCIMFISSPIIEVLSNINAKMVLPHFLSGVQKWMRESEDATQKLVTAMLKMDTVSSMIIAVLVVGLLTAIAEEFMFRGIIQTIFVRWTKNTHAAIWITAIMFSAFHMEFFGFLPRLFLGAMFGYFVAWSGSIWTSVWAHFINNGTAVVVTYLYQHKKIKINPDDQHVFNYMGYIISMVIVLFLLYIYRNINLAKKQLPEY